MTPRYCEPISVKDARLFMRLYISERANIPNGSRCLWLAGVQYVTDQPGVYLVGTTGGLQGIQVIPPIDEQEAKAS